MIRPLRRLPLFVGGLLLVSATHALGQTGTSTLTGTIADNVGIVPGATITATQAQTSVVRTAVSNDQGVFRIPALPPGRYAVKVEMDGFRPIAIEEFNLLANETRDLGRLVMTAGGVTESVTITAEVTPVQTANSALARNITSDTLVSVQVKGRDIFGMMKILPGVMDSHTSRDYAQWNSGRYLSINGGDSLNKNTTIDGVPVGEEGGSGTTHITPNIDSIGEVNVITSGYNAEHGRQSSGLISIVTKSGTNQVRGSAWYNMRRDEWNKNDFFRVQSGQAKPFFEVNIGGYSIGGPVVIPKLIDSRTSEKKIYFFFSQEFTEDIRPTDVFRTNMPTARERQGDFSQTFFGKATLQADGTVTGANTLQIVTDPLTGQPFENNVIPQHRINPIGQNIINLLNLPNDARDRTPNAFHNSNDATDTTPLHTRTNLVSRADLVWSQNTRFSFRALFDRDNSITYNVVQPRESSSNNVFPGDLVTGSMTKVISPSLVNELVLGYSHNHYGFREGKGKVNQETYLQYYRDRYDWSGALPRIEDFDPNPGPIGFSRYNKQEWPFMPDFLFSGGNRSNLQPWRPFGGRSRIAMTWNENYRFTVQDDLSWTKGRHNFKFGFATERNSKTEPGSADYTGVFNFGHNADNPISSGNGFANALLGVVTDYSERDNRLDRDNLHWYSAAYVQDSWRLTSRMTLDFGLRVEHHGAFYESRRENSGFDPRLWDPSQAPELFTPACRVPTATTANCSSANQAARNPVTGELVSRAYVGSVVPGTGSILNGMWVNGLNSHPTNPDPGKKDGWYYDLPMFSWAPRVGFAWDVLGDGSTAVRASGGVFYNFVAGLYPFNGGPLISRVRTIRNSTIGDIAALAAAGTAFAESPQSTALPDGFPLTLYGQQLAPGELEPERNYQMNVAFQRDIGFNTVAEVAYVTNIGRKYRRTKTTNNIPINAYANPANLFNNEPINANFLRRDYEGVGSISYLTTDDDVLNYNAMQTSIQRRLSRGLQMGLAYTLSWNRGVRGWDFMTEELGGKELLRERYYGPPAGNPTGVQDGVQDRRHILVVNYSYMVPNPTPNVAILKHLLRDWEASGVVQYVSGAAVDPGCGTNIGGVNNSDPSLSGGAVRCELVPGEDPFAVPAWTGDPNLHDAFRPHFNLAAFRRPQPVNGVGNQGNVPVGFLRHPGWQNWDFTLARRIPIDVGRGGSVRVQAQFYNMWNQVQFQRLAASYTFATSGNTNTTTGQFDQVTNPFNFGLTVRLDY